MPLDKRWLDVCHEYSRRCVENGTAHRRCIDLMLHGGTEQERADADRAYDQTKPATIEAGRAMQQMRREIEAATGVKPPILRWWTWEEHCKLLDHPMVNDYAHGGYRVPCDRDGVPLAQGATHEPNGEVN